MSAAGRQSWILFVSSLFGSSEATTRSQAKLKRNNEINHKFMHGGFREGANNTP